MGESQADNINTLVNAAGIKMEPYWANLFSKLFANKNIGDLIANVGAGKRPALTIGPLSRALHRATLLSASGQATANLEYQGQLK